MQVLLARARAALREAGAASGMGNNGYYDDGRLSIDVAQRRVMLSGALVDLTATEYQLLVELYRNAGRVLTYDQILESVWGDLYRDSPQYVHVYVYRLRQKLEEDPGQPRYLQTEHGVGYRFEKQAKRF
jgi:two-component system KDP operon response regulator KdpE